MTTMYLSKYALSDEIKEVEIDRNYPHNDGYAKPLGYIDSYKIGRDIHHDRADAVATAKVMAAKRIMSLRKQIAKLESMTFE